MRRGQDRGLANGEILPRIWRIQYGCAAPEMGCGGEIIAAAMQPVAAPERVEVLQRFERASRGSFAM
jgi:hypothetical protein